MNSSTTAPAERSPDRLFLAILALAVIIVGGLSFGIRHAIAPSMELVETMVRSPLPESLRPIYAQQTPNGEVAEFFDSATNHKFSLARAPLETESTATPRDLMNGIVDFQRSGLVVSGLAPLSVRFSQALFKGRSAYDLSDTSVPVAGGHIEALSFLTTKGANHAMTIVHRPGEQITLLALMKNSPVDLAAFGRFIELALDAPGRTRPILPPQADPIR